MIIRTVSSWEGGGGQTSPLQPYENDVYASSLRSDMQVKMLKYTTHVTREHSHEHFCSSGTIILYSHHQVIIIQGQYTNLLPHKICHEHLILYVDANSSSEEVTAH